MNGTAAPVWLDALYWAAIFSNMGPIVIYAMIMIGTRTGLSLPERAEWGARHFFSGCSQAHVVMFLMLVSMPLKMWYAMAPSWLVTALLLWHFVANLEQTVGGATAIYTVSANQIRRIDF